MLGGIPLHGRERGNIEVFAALRGRGVEPLFVTHREYGHEAVQPALDGLGLPWTTGAYPRLISRGMGPRAWASRAREVAAANVGFWRAGRRFRPTHVHVCNEADFVLLLPAVRALGVPVVFRLGDAPRQHRPLFRRVWRQVILPNVDHFVCVSEYVRGRLLEAGADPAKVRVIYNAPPQRPPGVAVGGAAARTDGDAALAATEPFRGRTVVYVGQLNESKGVHLLVETALSLCQERDDVRFLIAGDYEWQNPFARSLMRRVEGAGLADRLRFLGYVNDVPGLLALADVHAVPSVWEEPLGNVFVEAKQAGAPSVVFPSGGLPELVTRPGRDGVVCAEKTASALKEGLRHYLDQSDRELEASKSAATVSLASLGITREGFARAWLDVYRSTAETVRARTTPPVLGVARP